MTRMQAETKAAEWNASRAMTCAGASYAAQSVLGHEWAVVTYVGGKPVHWEY